MGMSAAARRGSPVPFASVSLEFIPANPSQAQGGLSRIRVLDFEALSGIDRTASRGRYPEPSLVHHVRSPALLLVSKSAQFAACPTMLHMIYPSP